MANISTIYEFEFQFPDSNIWYKTDLQVSEALEVIKTGLLTNKPITKIKLFAITEDTSSMCFIYDVAAAKQGNQPWSLLATAP